MFEEINNLYGLFVMNNNLQLFVQSLSFLSLRERRVQPWGICSLWNWKQYPSAPDDKSSYEGHAHRGKIPKIVSLFSYKIIVSPLVGLYLFLVEGGRIFFAFFGWNSGPDENISHPTPKNRIYSWWKNLYTPLEGKLKRESTMIFSCIVW